MDIPEPPPRLFTYQGFFTDMMSVDLTLKIVFTSICFFLLLLFSAWTISRKQYNRAPEDKGLRFQKFSDLMKIKSPNLLNRATFKCKGHFVASGFIENRKTLFIDDWKLIMLYENSSSFDCYFSLAPAKLRKKWFGLLLSDDTLRVRSELRQLVLYACNKLNKSTFYEAGKLMSNNLILNGDIVITNDLIKSFENEYWNIWIANFIIELLFFGQPGISFYNSLLIDQNIHNPLMINNMKLNFIKQLELLNKIIYSLHINGDKFYKNNYFWSLINTFQCNDQIDDLLININNFLHPLVRHYLKTFVKKEINLNEPTNLLNGNENVLIQLIQAHHLLNEEGNISDFLTFTHIIHIIMEICLIVQFSLTKCLKNLFIVLALKPKWQDKLRIECGEMLRTGSCTETNKICPSTSCLSLKHTECLVWTKALIHETMRISMLGWPLGSLYQALKDDRIYEQDFCEGELILLNQPAYYYSSDLWFQQSLVEDKLSQHNRHYETICETFDPMRFIEEHKLDSGTRMEISLPVHWARTILQGFVVCVPNKFLYLCLISIILNMFGKGLNVSVPINDPKIDNTDNPISWFDDFTDVLLQFKN